MTKRYNKKEKLKQDEGENISLKTKQKYISAFDFTTAAFCQPYFIANFEFSQKLWLWHVNYILKLKKEKN